MWDRVFVAEIENMPRGPKKHLKRLNAPKHWMLDKLGGIFVSSGDVDPRLHFY